MTMQFFYPGPNAFANIPGLGGGASIPEWGTGATASPGVVTDQRIAVTVEGEPCAARWTGTQWVLVAPTSGAQAYTAANPMPPGAWTAPTIPVARQTWNAGWRLAAYDPNPFTTEVRPFRLRFQNQTGQAVQDFSLDVVHHLASPQLFEISAGPADGTTNNATAWSTQTVSIPAAPNGTIQPGYNHIDFSLPAPVANNGEIIVSVRAPTNSATAVQGMNSNAWPDFQFPRYAAMAGDEIAVDGAWPGGVPDFLSFVPGIHFRNLTGAPVVQIAHTGDSLGEMERPNTSSPNPLSREGWCIRGNTAEIANGRRFWWNSIANGTYTLTQYLARVAHLVTTSWIDTMDVVSIQAWTHNERPANVAEAQAQWAAIEVVADAIRAAGRGVVYTLLSPPSTAGQSGDQIPAWQWIRDRIATEAHVYLDDLVADGTGTAFDVAYSEDGVHINQAGQILQANALPARTATALAALGYSV